ncbi:tRNA(adenine(34)) deaminase, chloroplastic [Amaranthus tricolor]|uniref:tRNA(adenine(34)) deaminase, chloroplastic n=1 Tax=Amaranthus tricolor TaxID=29722 RepID=UPI00258E83B5|nr:tRNA(adenine(34)) deaminase, chloroplastic [Amaranthus tricolor]
MMQTTYSSSIISLRRAYDYCYYSNERCPSTYCSCCCSFPIYSCTPKLIIPTNPSFLYGLRQSSLIQCPSRRFTLGSSDRKYCCRSLIYDVGHCCCYESCCVKGRVDRLITKSCKESCCVKEKSIDVNRIVKSSRMGKPNRDFRVYAIGDAEAMLDLLSEEVIEERVNVRERNRSFTQEGKGVRKQNVVIENLRDVKGNVDCGYSRKSEMKRHQLELGRVGFRNSSDKKTRERENLYRGNDVRLRKMESGSSCCSLLDSGDIDSDTDVEIKRVQLVGESSTANKKDGRKSSGVVIREETKQNWERYRNEKDQELRSSTRDDRRISSSIQRDCRNKSEGSKSWNESVSQSQLSGAKEINSMIASSSKKQSSYGNEKSTSDVTLVGQSSSHNQIDKRADRFVKSSSQHEHSTHNNRENIVTTSDAWRRFSQDEDSNIADNLVQEAGCDYCKTCGRSMEERERRLEFQQHMKQSEMNADGKLAINAESLLENSYRKQERNSSSLQSSIEEERNQLNQVHEVTEQGSVKAKSQYYRGTVFSDDRHEQSNLRVMRQSEAITQSKEEKSRTSESRYETRRRAEPKTSSSFHISAKDSGQDDQIYLMTGQVDARRRSQKHNKIMKTDASYLQSTSNTQKQSETGLKQLEGSTISLDAAVEGKGLHEESLGKVTKDIESHKVSHTEISDSRVHSSNLEIDRQSVFDKKIHNEQTYSKVKVKSVEESVEKRKWIDETMVQSTVCMEAPGISKGQVSQSVPLVSQFSEEEAESGQFSVSPPPYHYLDRRSHSHKTLGSPVRNDMGGAMEMGSGTTLGRMSSLYGEIDDRRTKASEEYSSESMLVSAARMQESSNLIVDEFFEKLSHEASTSEISPEQKLRKTDIKHQGNIPMLKRSTQLDTDKTLEKQGSNHSSGISSSDSEMKRSQKLNSENSSPHSVTKGSSDQMWEVKDHIVEEVSERGTSEGATSESVVTVRTGKFLWNVVANICRLRWSSHSDSEKQKSPVRAQSSPSGSAGETWFSGDDAEEASSEGMKAEPINLLQKTTSDPSPPGTSGSQKGDVVVNASSSSSSSPLQISSLSGGVIVGESANLDVPQHMSIPIPSVDLSIDSARKLKRSFAFEDVDDSEKNEEPVGSPEEQRDYAAEERHTDVSGSQGIDISASEETDVEFKRKRLQRSKLVLQRFDEWEDAYKRDREQKKVDEIFMREALSEAIKAADSWEVPIGAVLVQNGKIIARGYNLVEELRDSTAHAEMLCIREASNVLRTWRLSETTLYVTLEPCPMCAGAILQARISTLVWGAPNKLLGADGSWIRLFPESMEGEERSDVADKPAAPVHPFHPKMNIRRGILQEECADIMQQFFQLKRRKAKAETPSEDPAQPSCFPKPHHRPKLLHKMHNVFHPSKQSD